MKPTHVIRCTGGIRYYWAPEEDDLETLTDILQTQKLGLLKFTILEEDPNWQSEKRYKEKTVIVTIPHIIGIEDV